MKTEWKLFTFAAMVVGGLWGGLFLIVFVVRICGNISALGQMGDAFNMLNCLFAGLAFAAVCFQLWVHQKQIDEERDSRQRADRISVLSTRIQVTFDKILYERELLIQVAPGFKNVSFLHDGDGAKTGDSIQAKEGLIKSLEQMINEIQTARAAGGPPIDSSQNLKDLWDHQAAIPMMKQIKKWVEQLAAYEDEMDKLLNFVPSAEEKIDASPQ